MIIPVSCHYSRINPGYCKSSQSNGIEDIHQLFIGDDTVTFQEMLVHTDDDKKDHDSNKCHDRVDRVCKEAGRNDP